MASLKIDYLSHSCNFSLGLTYSTVGTIRGKEDYTERPCNQILSHFHSLLNLVSKHTEETHKNTILTFYDSYKTTNIIPV